MILLSDLVKKKSNLNKTISYSHWVKIKSLKKEFNFKEWAKQKYILQ